MGTYLRWALIKFIFIYLSLSGSKEGGGVGEGAYSRLGTYLNIKYVTNLVVFVQSTAAPRTVWQSHPCIL